MIDHFNIKGKTVLITGATGGLGLVMARGMAEAGARVIINGHDPVKLKRTIHSLQTEGFNMADALFDIRNLQQVSECIEALEKKYNGIDILVNNAGIQKRAPLEEFALTDWEDIMDTNLKGAFIVGQAVARRMIDRKAGKIINICSLQSHLGRPTIAPYSASKGGLWMLTRAMATEWAKYNIQVNGIAPGYFKTDMTKALHENPEFDSWLCKRAPAERWGLPEELIGTLIFLASTASTYVNGQVIYVDGGISVCI